MSEQQDTAISNTIPELLTVAYLTPNGWPKHFSDLGGCNGSYPNELRRNWSELTFKEDAERSINFIKAERDSALAALAAFREQAAKVCDKYKKKSLRTIVDAIQAEISALPIQPEAEALARIAIAPLGEEQPDYSGVTGFEMKITGTH